MTTKPKKGSIQKRWDDEDASQFKTTKQNKKDLEKVRELKKKISKKK